MLTAERRMAAPDSMVGIIRASAPRDRIQCAIDWSRYCRVLPRKPNSGGGSWNSRAESPIRSEVERCVAMAKIAPDDPYAGLADKARLFTGEAADLDIFDPTELDAETLIQTFELLAVNAEDIKARIAQKALEFRGELDDQYKLAFGVPADADADADAAALQTA